MILNVVDVRHCLDKAREIAEHYDQYVLAKQASRSVDELVDIVRTYLRKRVLIKELQIKRNLITAGFLAFEDAERNVTYEIYLLQGLVPAERRFALCKELFHVILDAADDRRSTNIYGHLEEITATFPVANSQPNKPAVWEMLAQAAAMQFLFPLDKREEFLQNGNGNPDYAAASDRYGIPQIYIEEYCSDAHMEFFRVFK